MTETVVVTQEQPRPRRRGLTALIVVVVVVGVLVGAFIAVDAWARQQVADYVAEKVRSVLSLNADEPVAVEIGGTSVIAQVVVGRLDRVEVDVDEVTVGDLTGGVRLVAEGVPTDVSKPVDRVRIDLSVTEDDIQSIAHTLSATAIDSVMLVDDEIQFTSELSFFGVAFDIGISVEPVAEGGEIGFTPTSVEFGGATSSADALIEQFGAPAQQLLKTQSICVAEWLPDGVSVDDVRVSDARLEVTLGAKALLLDEQALSTLGSCG